MSEGYEIEIVSGSRAGDVVPLTSGDEIGRTATLAIHLEDQLVSRRHARFTHMAWEDPTIEDLGSSGGTSINGRRLAPKTPTELANGTVLQFGDGGPVVLFRPRGQRPPEPILGVYVERADHGRGGPWYFPVTAPRSIAFGRGVECDISLRGSEDEIVSRRHCELFVTPTACVLVDPGSANGTLVDGHNVFSKGLTMLSIIQLGSDDGAVLRIVTGETALKLSEAARSASLTKGASGDTSIQTIVGIDSQLATTQRKTKRPLSARLKKVPLGEAAPKGEGIIQRNLANLDALERSLSYDDAVLACACCETFAPNAHYFHNSRREIARQVLEEGSFDEGALPPLPSVLSRRPSPELVVESLPAVVEWFLSREAFRNVEQFNAGVREPRSTFRVRLLESSNIELTSSKAVRRELLKSRDKYERDVARLRDLVAELADDFVSGRRDAIQLAEQILLWSKRRVKLSLLRALTGEFSSEGGASTEDLCLQLNKQHEGVLAELLLFTFHDACIEISERNAGLESSGISVHTLLDRQRYDF